MHGARNIKFNKLNYNHGYNSDLLIDRSIDELVSCLAGWLAACLVDWLVGCMVNWLIDSLISVRCLAVYIRHVQRFHLMLLEFTY